MKRGVVVSRSETISVNTTLMPEGYAGWIAKNIGTGNVEIDGFILEPGDVFDMSHIESVWNSSITITCQQNGSVRIMRLKYS